MEKLIRIGSLLKESSDRLLSDAQLSPDPALVAEGWQRRFTVDEPRGKEAAELYAQLGYEVRMEPVITENTQDDCHNCQASSALRLCTVYTRKREKQAQSYSIRNRETRSAARIGRKEPRSGG